MKRQCFSWSSSRAFVCRASALLLSMSLSTAAMAAETSDVHSVTLENGLEVWVKIDARAPVVVSMVWYKAGGIDETNGTTGVAHVLEHLMFRGTEKVPAGEFARRISEVGGRSNAFTASDYTGYHEELHKSGLELALQLEADRMANLQFDQSEFDKELRVVMEERRQRVDDNPRALLFEQLTAAMYLAHPYGAPVVGWMSDLESMRLEDAYAWYRTWYAPNNAVLVIAGDVDPKEVFTLAKKYFGSVPSRTLPQRKPQTEPEQRGMRRILVKAQASMPSLVMAYHAPTLRDVITDWEPYALSILAGVLDGHSAARLERELVSRARVAHSVSTSYDGLRRGPGVFYVGLTPAADKSIEEVEAAWREQLALIVEEGVTDAELQRVKAQVIAGQVYSEDSVYGQASRIGRMRVLGMPHDAATTITEKLREVTSEQVKQVARTYLIEDKLTAAVLDPQLPAERRDAQGNR